MASSNCIVFDGELITADTPVIPAVSRGLMYGDGAFETVRTYAGQTFRLDDHLQRLQKGMTILGMKSQLELENVRFRQLVYRLLERRQLLDRDAIVRLQVWRDGGRGFLPSEDAGTHFSITASACPRSFSPPTLATVDQRRIPAESLPTVAKFTNAINYILAAREAANQGADDALMQTIEGWISETSMANIFWVRNQEVYTPSVACDLIPGITRATVAEIIRSHSSLELYEGKFKLTQLLEADAAWLCNSVREVLPVAGIDEHSFPIDHPVLTTMQNDFVSYRNANLKPLKD